MLDQQGPNLWILRSRSLRMLADLQFRSIVLVLRDWIRVWPTQGSLLDFGSGTSPYRKWLPPSWSYEDLDPASEKATYRELSQIPRERSYDRILALEVLEHLRDPEQSLRHLRSLLKPNGELILSVPFAARIHPCPQDFQRWTPEGLQELCNQCGLEILEIRYRGSDLSTLTSKLLYFFLRRRGLNLTTLVAVLVSPILVILLILNLRDSQLLPPLSEDPLGFVLRLASAPGLR